MHLPTYIKRGIPFRFVYITNPSSFWDHKLMIFFKYPINVGILFVINLLSAVYVGFSMGYEVTCLLDLNLWQNRQKGRSKLVCWKQGHKTSATGCVRLVATPIYIKIYLKKLNQREWNWPLMGSRFWLQMTVTAGANALMYWDTRK